jgi:hypothetical protein
MQPLHRNVAIKLGHLIDEQMLDLVVYFSTSRARLGGRGASICGALHAARNSCCGSTAPSGRSGSGSGIFTAALTGAAVVAAIVALGGFVHLPLSETLEKVVLIAFLVSLPVTPIAWWLWWIEDGIRLTDPTGTRRKGHWRAGSPRLSGA